MDGNSKVNVHWMTVEKVFTFIDLRTGFQEPSIEKIFNYIEFKLIIISTLAVLAERTNSDVTELNELLQTNTISYQFNSTRKYGWCKNLTV